MRRFFYFSAIFLFFFSNLYSKGKIGFVNFKEITEKYIALKEAQQELDRYLMEWERTRDSLKAIVDTLRSKFEKEKLILSKEMQAKRLEDIKKAEMEYRNYVQRVWGEGGLLEQKMKEIVEPYTKKIRDVITRVAEEEGYDVILDISSATVIYADLKNDITQYVLDELNKEYEFVRGGGGLKPYLAVFPLKEADEESKRRGFGTKLQSFLNYGFSRYTDFRLVKLSDINNRLQRQNVTLDLLNQDICKQISAEVNAEFFVFGEVRFVGQEVEISISLYDASGAKKISETIRSRPEDASLRVKCADIAGKIISKYRLKYGGG